MVKDGYKRTDIGVIPNDWETFTIGDLFEFKNGLNKAKEFFGHGTPIVNYMDVFKHYGLKVSDIIGKVDVTREELKAYNVKKGDVFFTRTSETVDEIGITSVFLEDVNNTVFSGFILRARPINNRLDDYYKKYCFSLKNIRKQITSTASYTTRALTNGKSLSKVQIPIPSKNEQRAIAIALRDTDELIENLQKLISKKLDIKTATMQLLLTGKKRLDGFSDEWEEKKLGEIGNTFGGLTGKIKQDFGQGNSFYITFLNVMNNIVVNTNDLDKVQVHDGEKQNLALKGDLFFNTSSETPEEVGMCALLLEDVHNLYLNSFCFGFRLTDKKINGLFLSYLINSDFGRSFFSTLGQGATRYNLSKHNFNKIKIEFPNYQEQTVIATILSDMDKEIETLNTKLSKTKAIKEGMMSELLTGNTRLI